MSPTALPASSPDHIAALERKPVSDVKREGWRGIMKTVSTSGRLLMTNHERPEAVILSLAEYRALAELADHAQREKQHTLDRLARRFDDELAALRQPDAGERLRAAFDAPLQLRGEVIAGRSY